jgi:hypothetical protein
MTKPIGWKDILGRLRICAFVIMGKNRELMRCQTLQPRDESFIIDLSVEDYNFLPYYYPMLFVGPIET